MKKFSLIITIILALIAFANLNAGPISDAITSHIIKTFNFDQDMTEIECRPEIDTITISDSTQIIVSCREYPTPNGYFPVKVLLQDGSGAIRTLGTSIDVRLYENVLVAKNRVKSRDPISASDFMIERVETNKLVGNPIRDFSDLEGMQASKTISKGKILTEEMLELIPVVKRGERVKIVYESGVLHVESYGIAKKDAVAGEMVEVQNTASGRKVFGRASDVGIVVVER